MKSVVGRQKNIWDMYSTQLADHAKLLSDTLAKQMMGGAHPPGTVPVPRNVQLRQFLMLSVPRAQLTPQQAQDADKLWQSTFASRSPEDIKMWALDMAREYAKLTAPGPGEIGNPDAFDTSGLGLDAETPNPNPTTGAGQSEMDSLSGYGSTDNG